MLTFYGHDVSAVSHCDYGVLKGSLIVLRMYNMIQLLPDFILLSAKGLSYVGEFRRSLVRHLLLGENAEENTLLNTQMRDESGEVFVDAGLNACALVEPVTDRTDGAERGRAVEEVLH